MTDWIPTKDRLSHPLHIGLAAAMRAAIENGELPPGTKLPPHRDLAYHIGISVHTVSKAYEAMRHQGLIDSHVGRGSFVLDPALSTQQPFRTERDEQGVIDLSITRSVYDSVHVQRMEEALGQLPASLDPESYLACRPNAGLEGHRRMGVQWLRRCGLEASSENVIITNGVCNGMMIALATVARPGDTVVTEAPAHHLVITLCAYLGVKLKGVQTDRDGIIPDAFERACKGQEIKALFTVPSLATPTVTLMPEDRRRQLVTIARRHNVTIVEDDAWGPVMENRPPPISMLAPERSIYLTSFTKSTIPGLRTGYLVAPAPMIPALTGRMLVFNWMATPLVAELASRWIEDGTADELVSWQRRELAERHAIVKDEMEGFDWAGHPAALHFWLNLPGGWRPETLVDHARTLRVAVAPARPFMPPECKIPNAVRISVGGGHTQSGLRQGLKLLKGLLKTEPELLAKPF